MIYRWLVLALVLAVSGLSLWLGLESQSEMLAALALSSIALLCTLAYFRIQAERRWRTALDAYADRVLAQHRRHKRPGAPKLRFAMAVEQQTDR